MIKIRCFDGEEVPLETLESLPWGGTSGRETRARHHRWRGLLSRSPFVDETHRPLVWLAEAHGRPVGCLLGVPFHARGDGLLVRGHWGVDLLVHPDYRGRGVGRGLLEHWRDATPLALGLGITDSAFRIETSLGWKPVKLPPRLVRPLSARGRLLARRGWGHGSRRLPHSTGRAREVVVSLEMPRGVDTLYSRIAGAWPWHVCRDEAELLRRYPPMGSGGFLWVSLWYRGTLESAAVVRVHRNRVRRKMWLYELLAETGGPVLERLLEACLDLGASLEVDLVEVRATDPGVRGALRGFGFKDGVPEDRFIVHARDPALRARAPWRRGWHLSLGDSGNL